MSFGWSLGDIFAGIKILWSIYDAVSDGPLNATLQCEQFFEEFSLVVQCLEDWERKAQIVQDDSLVKLHVQLQQQCEVFILRHFNLIQAVNPESKAIRDRQSTWLKKVSFSREQVSRLYQQARWPFENKEVARLRKKLMLFLALATYHVSSSTHNVTVENRDILLDIRASNLEVVSKNLDLVSLIIDNLKRLADPLQSGHQTNQIDYSTLRQFENALLPPQPIRAIEASPARLALPFGRSGQHDIQERQHYVTAPSITSSQDSTAFEQDNRVVLSERLQNFRQRSARSHEPTTKAESSDGASILQQLLERLRDTRTQIGDVVGFPTGNNSDEHLNLAVSDPRGALLEELGVWDAFEERVQYEVQRRENLVVQVATNAGPAIVRTSPQPIPSPRSPTCLSPNSSPPGASSSEGWYGSPGSPESYRGSFLHARSPSASSVSTTTSLRLPRCLPVILQYQDQGIHGSVQYYSRSDDGEVLSITTISHDEHIEVRHSIERVIAGNIESSMKPHLDNSHVSKVPKYRVQFLGSHVLKVTKIDSQVQHKSQIRTQPKYRFANQTDYLEFQQLLLNKEVSLIADVEVIKSKEKEPQCRLGTIRILVEPIYKSRSILYFRGTTSKEQKTAAFVEWPTSLFKEPKEPSTKCKSLTLESANGKSLSISKGSLSRRSTQGSVTTIASFESANAAHSRLQERSNGKGIKGLIIDFYDSKVCHDFWKEFMVKDIQFSLPDPAMA